MAPPRTSASCAIPLPLQQSLHLDTSVELKTFADETRVTGFTWDSDKSAEAQEWRFSGAATTMQSWTHHQNYGDDQHCSPSSFSQQHSVDQTSSDTWRLVFIIKRPSRGCTSSCQLLLFNTSFTVFVSCVINNSPVLTRNPKWTNRMAEKISIAALPPGLVRLSS